MACTCENRRGYTSRRARRASLRNLVIAIYMWFYKTCRGWIGRAMRRWRPTRMTESSATTTASACFSLLNAMGLFPSVLSACGSELRLYDNALYWTEFNVARSLCSPALKGWRHSTFSGRMHCTGRRGFLQLPQKIPPRGHFSIANACCHKLL